MIKCELFNQVYFARPPIRRSPAYHDSLSNFSFWPESVIRNKCWARVCFGLDISGLDRVRDSK